MWSRDNGFPKQDGTLGDLFTDPCYSIRQAVIVSLDGATSLSSLAPVEHLFFGKARRNWDGSIEGGVDNSIVNVFVR